jgi:nucleotide-binding universal stress UspA family protein
VSATSVLTTVNFDRILFATDYAREANVALDYAVGIARQFSSTIKLTNVIDLSLTFPALDVLAGPALEGLRTRSQADMQQLAQDISGVSVTTQVLEGFEPASLIIDEAASSHADLIVLGTTSKQGFKKFALGSTAEEIIRTAKCPILTVGPHVPKPPFGPISFRRILYATDFSSQAQKAATIAMSLGQKPGAKLYLCHVVSPKEDAAHPACDNRLLASLQAMVADSGCKLPELECSVEHGEAADAILALANKVDADLIVLGARKASFWLSYVETGVTPALLARAHCPVLTVS